jgi:hypothetical protein
MERDAPESKLVHICDESLRPPAAEPTMEQLETEMKSMDLNVAKAHTLIFTRLPTSCCFSVPVKCCVLLFSKTVSYWSSSLEDIVGHQVIALYKCPITRR